jgi:Co/Zn/Cd efflux system component
MLNDVLSMCVALWAIKVYDNNKKARNHLQDVLLI